MISFIRILNGSLMGIMKDFSLYSRLFKKYDDEWEESLVE